MTLETDLTLKYLTVNIIAKFLLTTSMLNKSARSREVNIVMINQD